MNDALNLLPDIPRIYTALAEWMACLLYILPQKKRFNRLGTGAIAGVFLVVQAAFLILTGNVPLAWWMPCMAMAVGLMFLLIFLCCEAPAVAAGYYCARAFILAEFAASFVWQMYCLFGPSGAPLWPTAPLMVAGYAAIGGMMLWLQHRAQPMPSHIGKNTLFTAILMALTVFSVSNIGFLQRSRIGYTTDFGLFYVRTLVDFAGILILTIQQRQLYEAELRRELDAADNTLQRQYEQYRQSRENIHLLNRRYHDLKLQIATIRAERDPGKQAAYLAEMETGLRQYESEYKTDNAVLDTILTSKSLYCSEHGINLTCVADGKVLDFLSTVEICTVVGAALDDAIAAVKPLPAEQRLIRVAIYTQNGLVMVRVEHYCGESTTPAHAPDPALNSLRTIAEKYNGSMTQHREDNWDCLRVLLVPEGEGKG